MNKRAFTLIELLVVVAIVAILAAFLFPVMAHALRKAHLTTCTNHLAQIGKASQLYAADWGEYPNHNPFPPHDDPLKTYGVTHEIYLCPESPQDLAGAYIFRYEIELFPSDFPRFTRHYRREEMEDFFWKIHPQPESVLAVCTWHLTYRTGNSSSDDYLVLRANGAVQQIPSAKVTTWSYRDGRWYSPGKAAPSGEGTIQEQVFPNEPWPPQFDLKDGQKDPSLSAYSKA